MTVGQRDKGNHAWSCALCNRSYANSVYHCDHCWQQNGVAYALDVKNEYCWFCELCNQGAGNYQWNDTCEHYRWCHACQKRHRTDEVCPKANFGALKKQTETPKGNTEKKTVSDPFDDETLNGVFDLNDLFRLEDEKEPSNVSSSKKSIKLFKVQKQSDKLSQNANVENRPILRKLLERNEDIDDHPKRKQQPLPKQCLHPSNRHMQPFIKKPLGVHVKSRINLRKPSDEKSVKPKGDGQSPKAELKRPKPSDADKYPLLTRSHIRYSDTEEPKQPSPTDKQPLPKIEDEKQPKDEALSSKVERPVLQYNIDADALVNNFKEEPLAISGLSNIGKAAEMRENSRLNDLKSQLKQASKVRTTSKPMPDGFSEIVPQMSKVVKKEEQPFSTFGKPTPTPRSSFRSSGSDSEKSETPKGNAKDPKIYTNKPTDNLQKSAFKKIYKEDEGNETPSNSQSSSKFNLLKSSKNKNAAPNASCMKSSLTKLPASHDGSRIGFKAIEGSKELPKINGKTPKSDDVTPTPKEETPKDDTPNGDTPKGETPKSDAKNDKSDGSFSSDDDKQSKRSESRSSHQSQTPKSEINNASDEEDKKSSHSKASKSSSEKSVKTYSHDSNSDKHSDVEGSKSDKGSDEENKSSEHNESSEEESSEEENEHSEEEEENSKEESEPSEMSEN